MRKKKKWNVRDVSSELLELSPAGRPCPDSAALKQAATLMVKSREGSITIEEREQLFVLLGKMGMMPSASSSRGFVVSERPN